jgi:hypothetical protein
MSPGDDNIHDFIPVTKYLRNGREMEKLVSAELDDVVLEPISGLFERVHRRDLAEQLRDEVGRGRRGIVVPEDLCGCDGRLGRESGLARGEGPVDGKTESHLWCLLVFIDICWYYRCLLVFVVSGGG